MQDPDSNRLSVGPMMQEFETQVARLHDRRFGLMCNSGTSALRGLESPHRFSWRRTADET